MVSAGTKWVLASSTEREATPAPAGVEGGPTAGEGAIMSGEGAPGSPTEARTSPNGAETPAIGGGPGDEGNDPGKASSGEADPPKRYNEPAAMACGLVPRLLEISGSDGRGVNGARNGAEAAARGGADCDNEELGRANGPVPGLSEICENGERAALRAPGPIGSRWASGAA